MGTLNNQKTVAYEKTVREIAEEIGVSKQAVFKKINRQPLSTKLEGLTSTVDGRLMVSVDGEKLIKEAFEAKNECEGRQPSTVNRVRPSFRDAPANSFPDQSISSFPRTPPTV